MTVGEENEGSMVAKLSYFDVDFLFTGDITGDELALLPVYNIDAEIVIYGRIELIITK